MQKLLFVGLLLMVLLFFACGGGGGGAYVDETTSVESNQFGKASFGKTTFE